MTSIPLGSVLTIPGGTCCCNYHHLRDLFAIHGRIQTVTGRNVRALRWPEGAGCYVVRILDTKCHEGVLYIGKCGKLVPSSGKWVVNGSSFAARAARWTPYCFQKDGQWTDHFEYGPRFNSNNRETMPLAERYSHHTPISEIQIDCFITTGNEKETAPALIETLLLQNHFAMTGKLPPANQEL